MTKKENYLFVDNYGEMLAQINQMDLISFEEDSGYQGEYCAILFDGERLFYYIDSYGSCSGCDWLEDIDLWGTKEIATEKRYIVPPKEAIQFCGELKPKYIVPKDMPLKVISRGKYSGFKVKSNR